MKDNESVIDHTQCAPDKHDPGADGYPPERARTPEGDLACNDCLEPMFYCTNAENYIHVDPEQTCFLIQREWKV